MGTNSHLKLFFDGESVEIGDGAEYPLADYLYMMIHELNDGLTYYWTTSSLNLFLGLHGEGDDKKWVYPMKVAEITRYGAKATAVRNCQWGDQDFTGVLL